MSPRRKLYGKARSPRAFVPESSRRTLRLTPGQKARAATDWAEAVSRAERRPGSWQETLAGLAGRATSRTPEEVAKAWGLAPTWPTA